MQSQEIALRGMLEEVLGNASGAVLLLSDGDARERILETISSKGIDLMVIGTRGRGGLRRLVQGSLTERVVHEATCPSLVISRKGASHHTSGRFDPLRIKTILVPVNFSPNSARLLVYALRWASNPGTTIVLFHSVETAPPAMEKLSDLLPEYNPDLEKQLREAFEKMSSLAPSPERFPYRIEHEVRDGDATEQILQVARERRADLIIMGARVLAVPGLAWGSTIAGVVRDGRFPVLAVRHLAE
jgi:nucleotide-binding universal stress UspA family protein